MTAFEFSARSKLAGDEKALKAHAARAAMNFILMRPTVEDRRDCIDVYV